MISFTIVCSNIILSHPYLKQELIGQTRPSGKSHGGSSDSSTWRARIAFILGGLGVCVRFTSLAAWIPIGLILVLGSTSKIRTLFGLCAHCGLFGVLLGCCVDRWFYGFWAIPFLGNIHFNVLLGKSQL
jgi:hypothetical protein